MFEYLKAYLEFFTLTKSWRHTGANLLTILYVPKAIVLIRLICKEGTRAFSRRLIYELKLLGIEIDYQLNFDIHISSICGKASHQLNILKRLGRYLDRLSKLTIFHTFLLSNFNFCPFDCLPYLVVLPWSTSNMFEYLKAYLEFFTLTKSWRHTGANLTYSAFCFISSAFSKF
jgi:hypothetical protein